MQVLTRYEREINRCGDTEANYTLWDFDSVPAEDLLEAVKGFFRDADGDEIKDYDDEQVTGWGDPDYLKEWDSEKKVWA